MKPDEIRTQVGLIQVQPEQLKTRLPREHRFIDMCIYAVGQIGK